MFEFIGELLESLAILHGRTLDEVQMMYERVNCDAELLKGILEETISAEV